MTDGCDDGDVSHAVRLSMTMVTAVVMAIVVMLLLSATKTKLIKWKIPPG